jgi:hypothetical protein
MKAKKYINLHPPPTLFNIRKLKQKKNSLPSPFNILKKNPHPKSLATQQ